MSIFDRLGNLGRGIIQNAINPDAPTAPGDTGARQDQLRRAFDEGLLSAEEYRNKLRELSARIAARARGEDPDAAAEPDAEAPDPVVDAIRRAERATAAHAPKDVARSLKGEGEDVVEEREWEVRGPVKRTL